MSKRKSPKKRIYKNYYKTLVPTHLKRKPYLEGMYALEESIIHILFAFIEQECGNGKVAYQEKPKEFIIPDYDGHPEACIETYRGLKYGNACVTDYFVTLADLYFWFKFEEKDWFEDVEQDFDMANAVPDGEKHFTFEPIEGREGYSRMIVNKNRKYPDYKRKYEYNFLPNEYKQEIRKEKFKQLIDIYPSMWN